MEVRTINTELLVIGSGIAGLRAAAAAAEAGAAVTVVSKGPSASPEIMGFNAPVCDGDSIELYIKDMEESGCGLCDRSLVTTLADEVSGQISYMERLGLVFDKTPDGRYDAIHTLGTTYPRLIHYKSNTGSREMVLLKKYCLQLGVRFDTPVDILGLLKCGERIGGAFGVGAGFDVPLVYAAKAVVLATGGCGAMHRISTYPRAILGDGYAMAYRAGAELIDMEFQQFEPCSFIYPTQIEGKVIATTLLRHGARLLNGQGREFMGDYGLTRENAQKSTLSRAMLAEVKAGRGTPHGGIYYDMTMMSRKFLYEDHAIFTRPATEAGIDLTKEMPEMMPAAHTCLGGVRVDASCACAVPGLYACGEVTGGLHGANRIGGSAGAETIVFGAAAGASAAEYIGSGAPLPTSSELAEAWEPEKQAFLAALTGKTAVSVSDIRTRLGNLLTENVGIVRTGSGLKNALAEIGKLSEQLVGAGASDLKETAKLMHVKNMLVVAEIQAGASLLRRESRGVFYREDYPEPDDGLWLKNIAVRDNGNAVEYSVREHEDGGKAITA